jgi:asparagine synthase (glutamine-hydrolysing)
MCGIWALIYNLQQNTLNKNPPSPIQLIENYSDEPRKRGPDETRSIVQKNVFMKFHRLAINGLDHQSMQPFNFQNKIFVMCNGEIYNHKHLEKEYNIHCTTHSDCEIIGWLYLHYRNEPQRMIELLDGVFSIFIYDMERNTCFLSRDRHGVRPLYLAKYKYSPNGIQIISSTLSGTNHPDFESKQFPPNTTLLLDLSTGKIEETVIKHKMINDIYFKSSIDPSFITSMLRLLFTRAVEKRLMSDRKVCHLLSGGLDSSLSTSIVCRTKYRHTGEKLETFTIGLEGATDVANAQLVADFLGTEHTTITPTKEEFLGAIEEVIQHEETYDTTTIRAGIGNYLVCKYIKNNTNNVVVFNGDGSDELFGGYMYFHNAPCAATYHQENIRLLCDIHHFDVQRSDRCISSNGLEPRTPFLDHDLISFWLNINPSIRMAKGKIEKYWIRKAFEDETDPYLPEEILWRTKEAFSDGVSSQEDSLHTMIQEYVSQKMTEEGITNDGRYDLDETCYYHHIYNRLFPNKQSAVADYMWLPKWSGEQKDPSARQLNIYSDKIKNTQMNVNID